MINVWDNENAHQRCTYACAPRDKLDWPTDGAKIPEEAWRLATWLEERRKELARLNALRNGFNSSHEQIYLNEFMLSGKYPEVDILEPVSRPVALCDFTVFLAPGGGGRSVMAEEIEKRNQLVKDMFPEIKIKNVTTAKGQMTAFIGVTTEVFDAALALQEARRKVAQDIARAEALLTSNRGYNANLSNER